MPFALPLSESRGSFAARNNEKPEHYIGAWSTYYKAPAEAGALVGGDPLEIERQGR